MGRLGPGGAGRTRRAGRASHRVITGMAGVVGRSVARRRDRSVHASGAQGEVRQCEPGHVDLQVDGVPEQVAREAFMLAAAKLPIKTRFIQRIAE